MMDNIVSLGRVSFDFSVDGGREALNSIECLLRSGHWSDRALNFEDEWTMFLLKLLRFGDIEVYRHGYERQEGSEEIRRRAGEFNMFMNKRNVSQTLIDIAAIFYSHEYDSRKTEYNSLFFPELKAFVRYGGIHPDRLLELLGRDGCGIVYLFSDAFPDDGDVFFAVTLAMPKDAFIKESGDIRERIWDAIGEAVRRADEKAGSIFPKIPAWHDDDE